MTGKEIKARINELEKVIALLDWMNKKFSSPIAQSTLVTLKDILSEWIITLNKDLKKNEKAHNS